MIVLRQIPYRPSWRGRSWLATAFGMFVAFSAAANADDWQNCISNLPDRVLAGCSAVIEQGTRGSHELSRARVIRGEWYRIRKQNDEALADFDGALKLDPQ